MEGSHHDGEAIAESLFVPAAFGPVFDRHYEAIYGYLRRQLGRDFAEELASQTFLVAFDRRASFDNGWESARPWLFGIAVNLLRRHRRDVRRQLQAYARTGVDPVVEAFDGLEARLDAGGMRRELAAAMARVPAAELETLLLFAWGELTYAEIAETQEVPIGTVRSRIHRARTRIRELLEAEGARTGADPRKGGVEKWTRSS